MEPVGLGLDAADPTGLVEQGLQPASRQARRCGRRRPRSASELGLWPWREVIRTTGSDYGQRTPSWPAKPVPTSEGPCLHDLNCSGRTSAGLPRTLTAFTAPAPTHMGAEPASSCHRTPWSGHTQRLGPRQEGRLPYRQRIGEQDRPSRPIRPTPPAAIAPTCTDAGSRRSSRRRRTRPPTGRRRAAGAAGPSATTPTSQGAEHRRTPDQQAEGLGRHRHPLRQDPGQLPRRPPPARLDDLDQRPDPDHQLITTRYAP